MAGFKTHMAGGIASGAGFSLLGFYLQGINLMQAGAIFVVGSVAGLLPDLDSDTGKPLAFLAQLVAVLVPSLLYTEAARRFGNSPDFVICYFTTGYLAINYGLCGIIKQVTVHRGIMHSVPFAVLCAGIGYLLFASSNRHLAVLGGLAVFSGCVVHLLLDEFSAFQLKLGFIPVAKRSMGTALKFQSDSLWVTVFIYLLMGLVAAAVFMPALLTGHF